MQYVRSRGLAQLVNPPCVFGCGRVGVLVVRGAGGRRVCESCALEMDRDMLLVPRGRAR
jgi:hypothetical protein